MLRRLLVARPRSAVVGAVGSGLRSFCHVPPRLQQQGGADAGKQREMLERLLPVQEANFGPKSGQVANTLRDLGYMYGALGEWAKSREMLERLLTLLESHAGPNHHTVATTLTNLGNACGALGNVDKKRELLTRAHAIFIQDRNPSAAHVKKTFKGDRCHHASGMMLR